MEVAAVRIILGFLRPYPWVLLATAIFGLGASFAEGIGIGLLIPLLDVLLRGAEKPSALRETFLGPLNLHLGSHSDLYLLIIFGSGIMVLLLIKAALVFANVSLTAWINGRVSDDIRCALFQQMLTVDYGFVVRSRQGRLVSAFETLTWRMMHSINAFFALITSVCTIGVFTFLLVFVSWQLTLMVVVLGLAASILIGRPLVRRLRELGDAAVIALSAMSQRILTSLNGMRTIRAFGQQAREQNRFAETSQATKAIFFHMDRMERSIPALLEVAHAPIFLGAILIARHMAIGVPALLAFLLLVYRLQPYLRGLDRHRAELASVAGALLELTLLLDSKYKPNDQTGTHPFNGLQKSIVFDSVSFHYQSGADSRDALAGISIEIPARQVTAIVGGSGSGKTTLINLLYRFDEPTEGQIFVDGLPLAALDLNSWRARLALAGQDAALLDGSILENIAYGCPNAKFDSVVEAAQQAAVHDFVQSLPRGYQTDIGDRGVRLSEGQRQRIGLARALLRRPEILILDEAINALDGLNEQIIHKTLDRLAPNTTVIVITHRLNTILKADRAIVLKEGRLAEQGTPEELLTRGGTFSRLHNEKSDIG